MNKYYSAKILSGLKERCDIRSIIGEYTDLRKSGTGFRGENPFSENDREESLVVSPKEQIYECLDTGEGGDVFSFLMHAENLSLNEAVENLASRLNISLNGPSLSPRREEERNLILSMNAEAEKYFTECMNSPEGGEGADYFQKERCLSPKVIERFGLGYAPEGWNGLVQHLEKKGYSEEQIQKSGLAVLRRGGLSDKFRGRAMCPIMDAEGKIVGFSGRILRGDGQSDKSLGCPIKQSDKSLCCPKYLNSPETAAFDKKRCLYGLNFASHSLRNGIILCEGNMDVISQHQYGFDNAVAPMGTAFSDAQASLLKRYTNQIHLLYDSDEPGQKGAMKALSILKKHDFAVDVVDVSPHKDPDEFLHTERPSLFQVRVEQAEDFRLFEARRWMSGYDLSSREGKKEAFQNLGEKLIQEPEKEWEKYLDAAREIIRETESREETPPVHIQAVSGRKARQEEREEENLSEAYAL